MVLGLTLLLAQVVNRVPLLRGPLTVLAAPGSMTLTLYTVHVVALVAKIGPDSRPQLLLAHVVAAAVLATIWRSRFGRGPLEELVSRAAASSARSSTH